MNKKKILLYIYVSILVVLLFIIIKNRYEVSNYDKQIYNEVSNYLKSKYNKDFEFTKFAKSFNGDKGIYYRGIFKQKNGHEKGVVYCYDDLNEDGVELDISGKKYIVTDDYANVILAEEYANKIQELLGDDILVKCQLAITDYMLTEEELSLGIKSCLENSELYCHMFVFVFADTNRMEDNVREKVENFMSQYNAYRQYMYIIYDTDFYLDDWEYLYYDNYSDFEGCLLHRSNAEHIEFGAFHMNEPYEGYRIIKE